WGLAESASRSNSEHASIVALRELERILDYHRSLQRRSQQAGTVAAAEAAAVAANQPRLEQWGELAILELASAGASGEVWRAWDAWLQREVALKFLQALSGPAPDRISDS